MKAALFIASLLMATSSMAVTVYSGYYNGTTGKLYITLGYEEFCESQPFTLQSLSCSMTSSPGTGIAPSMQYDAECTSFIQATKINDQCGELRTTTRAFDVPLWSGVYVGALLMYITDGIHTISIPVILNNNMPVPTPEPPPPPCSCPPCEVDMPCDCTCSTPANP